LGAGTLVIGKATATVTLGSLNATYDVPRTRDGTTAPRAHCHFTYNGSATTPPTRAVCVVGTITMPAIRAAQRQL